MKSTFLQVPYNEDYSTLGSILGSPYLGKLPNWDLGQAQGLVVDTTVVQNLENHSEPLVLEIL